MRWHNLSSYNKGNRYIKKNLYRVSQTIFYMRTEGPLFCAAVQCSRLPPNKNHCPLNGKCFSALKCRETRTHCTAENEIKQKEYRFFVCFWNGAGFACHIYHFYWKWNFASLPLKFSLKVSFRFLQNLKCGLKTRGGESSKFGSVLRSQGRFIFFYINSTKLFWPYQHI